MTPTGSARHGAQSRFRHPSTLPYALPPFGQNQGLRIIVPAFEAGMSEATRKLPKLHTIARSQPAILRKYGGGVQSATGQLLDQVNYGVFQH